MQLTVLLMAKRVVNKKINGLQMKSLNLKVAKIIRFSRKKKRINC